MPAVTPCRTMISERFPVASFVVDVPHDRCFELACTTDPNLFRPDQRGRRTQRNFWSSRFGGLLRAPSGRATFLLPSDQLRSFAGAKRLYYALGTYGAADGRQAQFTVDPRQPERAPSIQLAGDFTGRSLDRRRLGAALPANAYGQRPQELVWGGDALGAVAAPAATGTRASPAGARPAAATWRGVSTEAAPNIAITGDAIAGFNEPPGCESPDELDASGSCPVTLRPAGDAIPLAAEPEGEPYGRRRAPNLRPVIGASRAHPGRAPRASTYGGRGRGRGFGNAEEDVGDLAVAEDPLSAQDPDYSDVEDEPLLAAAARAGRAPVKARRLSTRQLDIDAKFRVVQAVARYESNLRPGDLANDARRARAYGAVNRNTDGAGLSWGLIQFTQKGGALGDVLRGCQSRNAAQFSAIFDPDGRGDADALLATCTAGSESARMQPVGGSNLWEPTWVARFQAAGAVTEFQAAQNQVAIERYLDPHLPLAKRLGFDSERSLVMLYDRCVQQGNAGGPKWILRTVGPIRDPATDLPTALAALGFADLRAFQASVPGLATDGKFGTQSHAALVEALRALGTASPLTVLTRDQMLDEMVRVAAVENRFWHARPAGLRSDANVSDDLLTW